MQLNSYVVMLNLRITAPTSLDNCCYSKYFGSAVLAPFHLRWPTDPIFLSSFLIHPVTFWAIRSLLSTWFHKILSNWQLFCGPQEDNTWKKTFWSWLGYFWRLIKSSRVFAFKSFLSKSNFFQIFGNRPSPIS